MSDAVRKAVEEIRRDWEWIDNDIKTSGLYDDASVNASAAVCVDKSISRALAACDEANAELAAAKARNDKLSRALGTTCWQCEKCGEVRDSRPCVYCELAALKAAKAEAAEAWRTFTFNDGDEDNEEILSRYFGKE